MSTRHTILALLSVEPMTGYDLTQNLRVSLDRLWAATHSQIYPALHKLEEEGFVESVNETRGQHMQRIVYSLTPAGAQAFQMWLRQPIQYLPFRDPFMLLISYMDEIPPDIVFQRIDEHITMLEETAENLERIAVSIERGEHPLTRARAKRLAPERVERIKRTRSLIYYELAARVRYEIESTRRIRRYATQLAAETTPEGVARP